MIRVSAEYNDNSKTAYVSEPDVNWSITCSLKFFAKLVYMMSQQYGKANYHQLGHHGVLVSFGEIDE